MSSPSIALKAPPSTSPRQFLRTIPPEAMTTTRITTSISVMSGKLFQITARLREYVDAGITKFVLSPACGPDEMLQQMELQAETVVKAFHSARV